MRKTDCHKSSILKNKKIKSEATNCEKISKHISNKGLPTGITITLTIQ